VIDIIESIRNAAAPFGLNLVAAVRVDVYDSLVAHRYRASAIAPRAKSIVVIGNGGGAFWRAASRYAESHPGWWTRENPLDDFTREVIDGEVLRAAKSHARVIYPFVGDGPTLNFIELAKAAGLAGPTILGVVAHPVFGPWIAFRAALLLDDSLDAPGDACGFDPCPSCTTRTCIAACPVGAVAHPAGWDIPKCVTHRVENETDCATRCHARVGCVLGPEHRYPDDELAYHQMRALRSMRPWYHEHLKGKRS
jgi:epoxyqueuosine reductase QueG